MSIQVTDPIGALVAIAVILLIGWLVAYSAARMATDDLRTVRLTVSAEVEGSEVLLGIANRGMKPAYDVTLVPPSPTPAAGTPAAGTAAAGTATAPMTAGTTAAAVPALIGDVPPGGSVAARLDRAALGGTTDELPPYIRVEWRIDGPGGPKRWALLAIVRSSGGAGA
jgi:hypothetical protein